MQTFRTEAIILRRTNYGEADRILNLLTPDRGKISVIAKGVRRSKSKLAGGLELFATSDVNIVEGRGEMGIVTAARLIKFYGNLLHDYERMQLGYEFIKIVNRVAETVAEADFYFLLRDSFAYLNELTVESGVVELWFRLRFMALLGRGLNVATDSEGRALAVDQAYNFDFQDMAFVAQADGRFTTEHLKLLRLASAKDPAVLRQVSGIGQALEGCLFLVRSVES